jgi:hypothetical protein
MIAIVDFVETDCTVMAEEEEEEEEERIHG